MLNYYKINPYRLDQTFKKKYITKKLVNLCYIFLTNIVLKPSKT